MVAVIRKKKSSNLGPFKAIQGKISFLPKTWFGYIKPLIVLLCFLVAFLVYSNWYSLLESLDKTPIRSYALTHKTQFTTNSDIRETLSKNPTLKGYFSQDIQEVKNKLLEMPWVRDVVVRKFYPDRLGITILEHRPVAIWNNVKYLSEQGVVFSLPADRFDRTGLPLMYGPDTESKVVLEAWGKIQAELKARQLELKSVAIDNRGSWSITLSNNIELKLGRGEWTSKIDRFMLIFPEIDIPEGQRLAYVDLRYEHGAAVGFLPLQK